MIQLFRTDSRHKDFIHLVEHLDAELAIIDGDENKFYTQFNGIEEIKYALVAFENGKAVGCGAIKAYDDLTMEIKRMYVLPAYRGKGIATNILTNLEQWAAELSMKHCILETGKRQTEAVQLYQKRGYNIMVNYGQYTGVKNSLCFKKTLV